MMDAWFTHFLSAPDRARAAALAVENTAQRLAPELAADHKRCGALAGRLSKKAPLQAAAWHMLALRPSDESALVSCVVNDVRLLVEGAAASTARDQALEVLGVWLSMADGSLPSYGTDLFAAVHGHRVGADLDFSPRKAPAMPAGIVFDVLVQENWFEACETLIAAVDELKSKHTKGMADWMTSRIMNAYRFDRGAAYAALETMVQRLESGGYGAHAFACQMLMADSSRPATFWPVYPMLKQLHDMEMLPVTDVEDSREVSSAILVAQLCCEGVYVSEAKSLFDLTRDLIAQPRFSPPPSPRMPRPAAAKGPSVLIMPSAPKLNSHTSEYSDLVGAMVPLVVARDVDGVKRQLQREYPHALPAVDLLCRDLREGEPVRLAPVMLLGPPGTGKSRMGRRLAELLRVKTYRYDAASSADGMFGGSPKAWGNTVPSVPARAVAFSKTANVFVLVDEVEKAGTSHHNGNLWSAMTPFLERETSARYRDQSIDAEMNLSWVNYVATANDDSGLPPQLRDRFRVVRVPAPTLAHLPPLAANVVAEIEREEQVPGLHGVLEDDELAVIAGAWKRQRFSIRALQKMVRATLDARASFAPRN